MADAQMKGERLEYAQDNERHELMRTRSYELAKTYKLPYNDGGGGFANIETHGLISPAGLILVATGGGKTDHPAESRARTMTKAAQQNMNIPAAVHKSLTRIFEELNSHKESADGTAIAWAKLVEDAGEALDIAKLEGGDSGSGGDGEDSVKLWGINPSLAKGKNIPLKGGKKLSAVLAAAAGRCPPTGSLNWDDRAKTPMGKTENYARLMHRTYCAGVINNIVDALIDDFSLPQCDKSHQHAEDMRKSVGYKASKEKCRSNRELAEATAAMNRYADNSNAPESGKGQAFAKNNAAASYAQKNLDILNSIAGGGSIALGAGLSAGVNMARLWRFEDPKFIAMLESPEFKKLRLAVRGKLHEWHAEQDRIIAEVIHEFYGDGTTMYADSGRPGESPASGRGWAAPESFERSASLAQMFAMAGVGMKGGIIPAVAVPGDGFVDDDNGRPAVVRASAPEVEEPSYMPQVKAILVSAPGR